MVIVFNGVCNYGLVIAELLSRFDISCKLYTTNQIGEDFLNLFCYFKKENIITNDRDALDNILKEARVCINVSNGIIDSLGIRRLLFFLLIKKGSLINIPTGSDISEIELYPPLRKILFLMILKYGVTHVPHYFHSVRAISKYYLKNIFFAKHPYILQEKRVGNNNKSIIFFHPSNLDWGISDNKKGRNSIKNNVIFIEAFIKAAKHLHQHKNLNLKCLILDRGPDKEVARQIIHSRGGLDFFEWIQATTSINLAIYLSNVDLVVDQFYLGILGMISMEAMAQGKPVMIYIDKNYWPIVYNEEPPVINCHTEDEIYNAILDWADKKKLQTLGEKAEKWVRKYHDVHTADFSEFILRVCLAAGLKWPRKDLAKQEE